MSPSSPKTILLIHNNTTVATSVKKLLNAFGYTIIHVASSRKALKSAQSNGYSLVLSDIMIHDLCGWRLFLKMKQLKPHFKFVFLSRSTIPFDTREKLIASGVTDYISFPFDNNEFVTRINTIITS